MLLAFLFIDDDFLHLSTILVIDAYSFFIFLLICVWRVHWQFAGQNSVVLQANAKVYVHNFGMAYKKQYVYLEITRNARPECKTRECMSRSVRCGLQLVIRASGSAVLRFGHESRKGNFCCLTELHNNPQFFLLACTQRTCPILLVPAVTALTLCSMPTPCNSRYHSALCWPVLLYQPQPIVLSDLCLRLTKYWRASLKPTSIDQQATSPGRVTAYKLILENLGAGKAGR